MENAGNVVLSAENRQTRRNKVLKSGKIVLDDWTLIDCSIRDVSATGAKLRVSGQQALPQFFRLVVPSEHTIRPASIAWRENDSVGITFTGEPKKAPIRKY